MTYNFNPEKWFEIEREAIEAQHRAGEMDAVQRRDALEALQRRYFDMLDRLDGTYKLP
jgi:hypothetical protein